MKKIRRILRKIFRNAGFQRKIAPDYVDIMNEYGIKTVLDVGANDGDYGREIRDRGYKGLIVSFEPNPIAYKRLVSSIKNDLNWVAYPYALGEIEGNAKLNIAANDVMSSFKGLTDFGQSADAVTKKIVNAEIFTLDSFLNDHPEYIKNVYLKIDTQGFEMEVLRGASKSLDKIIAVQAEVALVHTYVDQIDWLDFILWMRARRYELATAVCNSSIKAQIREFDFVFLRK